MLQPLASRMIPIEMALADSAVCSSLEAGGRVDHLNVPWNGAQSRTGRRIVMVLRHRKSGRGLEEDLEACRARRQW